MTPPFLGELLVLIITYILQFKMSSPPELSSSTDVLIVGAGPTGLTLALELSLQKIPFRIFESSATRSPHSRALVIHPRTLELLRRHGDVQKFIDFGRFNTAVRLFTNKRFIHEADLTDVSLGDTEFPYSLMISQADTEKLMDKILKERGVVVERPVTLSTLEDSGTKIIAQFENQGITEILECKYVVGCDGAHSSVRKFAGMEFHGGTYPEDLILADVQLKWEHPSVVTRFMGSEGFLGAFPMPKGVFRLVCTRPKHLDDDRRPTVSDFEEALHELCPGESEIEEVFWMTRFRLHHRSVHNYRKGRIFVAGDAAHIHSPAGGQGMNTGMQDAVNLAWKLAMVLRCQKNDKFLDSYSIERHRVGQNVQKGTDALFELIIAKSWVRKWLRNTLVPWATPRVFGRQEQVIKRYRFISQLGIRYRHSLIVGTGTTYVGRLRGGDRLPDGKLMHDDQATNLHALLVGHTYHIILFLGIEPENKHDTGIVISDILEDTLNWLKVHTLSTNKAASDPSLIDSNGGLHTYFGLQKSGYILVRPDGYIEHIGLLTDVGELRMWLKR